jgi:hypothetical protein
MESESEDTVTIAILAIDKAHCLPLYLKCIMAQTFPKERTYLYIRTNNNTDTTDKILTDWVDKYGQLYRDIYFDKTMIDTPLEEYKPHQWNSLYFEILANIRQESVQWAQEKGSHYFVADCDNFIQPQTIETLMATNLPVVGPFLITGNTSYSNYHHRVDKNGYFLYDSEYYIIHQQSLRGLIAVDVIHCTYFIRRDILSKVSYLPEDNKPFKHEYVIFSENLRKAGIQQYIDNRRVYGRITFADNLQDLLKEFWLSEFDG